MLFRKKIEPCCAYCKHSFRLSPDRVACLQRGVVSHHNACSKFTYNPLKREPERPRKFSPTQEDTLFTL